MAFDSTTWIDPATRRNIDMVYDFLFNRTELSERTGRRRPSFSYAQLSKETGISPKQVQFACQKLAFKKVPYFKIHAISYGSKKGVKTTEKVELVRSVKEKK
jgi:hypothetical protein